MSAYFDLELVQPAIDSERLYLYYSYLSVDFGRLYLYYSYLSLLFIENFRDPYLS